MMELDTEMELSPQWEEALKRARSMLGENADDDVVVKMAKFGIQMASESDARAEELKKEKEESHARAEQLKEKNEELQETIFTDGLLELTEQCWAPTTEPTSDAKACVVNVCDFGKIDGIVTKRRFRSAARNVVDGETFGDVNYSEQSVASPVVNVLKDVIRGLDSTKTLGIGVEMALKFENIDLRVDSCVVQRRVRDEGGVEWRIPCGVQETKRPPSNSEKDGAVSDGKCLGQLYDYMMVMRHVFGVRYVFGILSTYHRWRVLWLDDVPTNAVAAATSLAEVTQRCPDEPPSTARQSGDPSELTTIPWHGNGSGPTLQGDTEFVDGTFPDDRHCNGTVPMKWNDPELCAVLATAVKKMSRSPVQSRPFLTGSRAYERLKADGRSWCARPCQSVNLGKFASPTDELYVLRIFSRGGGDGVACLAADNDGACCVVKFPIDPHKAEEEKELLRDIWQLDARVQTFIHRQAVVMPYVRVLRGPVDAEDLGVTREAVTGAIDRMLSKGFKHEDLKWEHIGAYRPEADDGDISVVLLDLARVARVDAVGDTVTARKDMIDVLTQIWPLEHHSGGENGDSDFC